MRALRSINGSAQIPMAGSSGSLIRWSSLPADARILELGCGSGLLWKSSIDRIPAGWKITLSDLSPGMLDAAWRNLVVTGRTFQFKEIDAQSIPFEDETFDAVIANHMLYHVPDRGKALAEIKRVLKTWRAFVCHNRWRESYEGNDGLVCAGPRQQGLGVICKSVHAGKWIGADHAVLFPGESVPL